MLSRQAVLLPAEPSDESALADMLQVYAREFSAFHPVEFGAHGRFVYRDLPKYWLEADRHPFLMKIDGETAGFVLVQQTNSVTSGHLVWEIAEFFVLGEYRRRGVGMEAAHLAWKRFPGMWQVRVLQANDAAVLFWETAILRFTGNPPQSAALDRGGHRWRVFFFDSTQTS
jgi:predicted acetyltransferase